MLVVIAGLLLVTGFLALTHAYLLRRLVRDTTDSPVVRRVGLVVAVLLALLLPATMVGVSTGTAEWLAWPGYLWMALWFYLVLYLLVLELPRFLLGRWWRRGDRRQSQPRDEEPPAPEPEVAEPGASATGAQGAQRPDDTATDATGNAPGPSRRLVLSRGLALGAGALAVGTVGYGTRTALGGPRVDRQQLVLPRLARRMDGTRLVVVSDIHLGPLAGRAHVSRIVERINDLDADVVAIVGDLVDGSVERRGADAGPLARIRARQGTFFVTGNHEYYSGHEEWIDRLSDLGVRTLRNDRTELHLRGGVLDLAGVNDLAGEQADDGPDLDAALGDRDPDRPVVLMAHQPVLARQAAAFGVDLQVSGHTHGGQMAPFGQLARLEQPVVSGLGRVDGVPVYVTNGAGFWGPPVRVGAPPEVSLLELRAP